ncbi:MAG: hypothetical protein LBM66_03780 [Bifidobacteriaceae bacterium]|jgi:hypothetical protein|nr:hypothetical protein [Bifidobacteriaceae bacterium]
MSEPPQTPPDTMPSIHLAEDGEPEPDGFLPMRDGGLDTAPAYVPGLARRLRAELMRVGSITAALGCLAALACGAIAYTVRATPNWFSYPEAAYVLLVGCGWAIVTAIVCSISAGQVRDRASAPEVARLAAARLKWLGVALPVLLVVTIAVLAIAAHTAGVLLPGVLFGVVLMEFEFLLRWARRRLTTLV